MPVVLETSEDATFVVDRIRDGTLQGERKEIAFESLREFRSRVPVVAPQSLEQKKQSRENQNFFERMSDRLGERGEMFVDIAKRDFEDDQTYAESILQVTGKVGLASVFDFMAEGFVSAGRGLSNITPNIIEDPLKSGATKAGIFLLDSSVGRAALFAAQKGIEAYQGFAQEHPRAAANIEAVTDIALLAAPVKAQPSSLGLIGKTGRAIEVSGLRSSIRTKRQLATDLVTPKQTAKVRREQVPRTTEEGLLRTAEVELTPLQKAGADEIVKTGISPRKSLQGNYNVIAKSVSKETDRLKTALAKTGARGRFNKQDYFDELDAALVRLQEKPALVGNAEISAKRIINEMRKLVEDGKPHVSDLLAARKKFDARLLKEGRGKILDPAIENAMSIALREVRQTTNNFIQKTVPTVGVRNSLNKQSSVLRAMDDIAVKAADEANSAINRGFRKALKVLTLRGELNQTAALLWGVGGMGAAAMFAPFITKFGALGAVTYVTGNLIMAPGGRKGLGKLLKLMDKATLKITDPAVLREMRADRALIVELLSISKEQISDSENAP